MLYLYLTLSELTWPLMPAGNTRMVRTLLPRWKEGRWKPYIRGFQADANELVRVCTLECGLMQAACASEQVSVRQKVSV